MIAFNAAGRSPATPELVVITPGEIPQAPSNLRVSAVSKNSIIIRWNDNANNERGFYVERSMNGVNFVRVATLGLNITSFSMMRLSRLTTFYFRVQAYNTDGVSEFTNITSTRTR